MEVKIFFKLEIGNQIRDQLANVSSNTTIKRSAGTSKGSNKRVVILSTAVTMEEWQM